MQKISIEAATDLLASGNLSSLVGPPPNSTGPTKESLAAGSLLQEKINLVTRAQGGRRVLERREVSRVTRAQGRPQIRGSTTQDLCEQSYPCCMMRRGSAM